MTPQTHKSLMRQSLFHVRLSSILLLLAAAVGAIPAVDLWISTWFRHGGQWAWSDHPFWRWLYDYGAWPALAMLAAAAAVWATSFVFGKGRDWRRPCLIMALTVLLGPGLIVNGLLKPFWGRPRPLHIEEFGGRQPFRAWWQPSDHLTTDRGFASGHAATGFALLAGALVVPTRWRRTRALSMSAALSLGTLVALGRLVQGKHFFSDVAVGAAITYWVAAMLLIFPFEAAGLWLTERSLRLGRRDQQLVGARASVLGAESPATDVSSPAS